MDKVNRARLKQQAAALKTATATPAPPPGMSNEHIMWQSPCLPQETVADAAARFVLETFGVDRVIVWGDEPGEFRFVDGCWCYRVVFNGGHWQVQRMAKMTPKAKSRAEARAEIKAARDGGAG